MENLRNKVIEALEMKLGEEYKSLQRIRAEITDSKYPEVRERMQSLLEQDAKITSKRWKAEIQSLQSEYDCISK